MAELKKAFGEVIRLVKRAVTFENKKERKKRFLNPYEKKFFQYKKDRKTTHPINLRDIEFPSKKGLVSIVLPVYNGEKYIGSSIESVLNQTYKNIELIVVNDGSKDATSDIVIKYALKDERVKLVEQENSKIPSALNNGFNRSVGEYYTWTSHDNIMKPNMIEDMAKELEEDPNIAMVFANMQLINKNGRKIRGHLWYEFPYASSNVILPKSILELNTFPNNTIGAAFMYRSSVSKLIGGYSKYRYTIEDYDYWMKINSLFKIKHVESKSPLYFYRKHKQSLTSKNRELGITRDRYKLMVFDDFRRDFYDSSLIWILNDSHSEIEEILAKNFQKMGHVIITKKKLEEIEFQHKIKNLCFFGETGLENRRKNHFILKIKDESFFLTHKGTHNKNLLEFDSKNLQSAAVALDIAIKNFMLSDFESRIQIRDYNKKLSVIVCSCKFSERLNRCLISLANQSANFNEYEIIVVNNNIDDFIIKETCEKLKIIYPFLAIKYICCPIPGLSYARNISLDYTNSEYLLYVDDDTIADRNLVKETINGLDSNKDFGVIGGQIILDYKGEIDEISTEELSSLWSNFRISDDNHCREVKNYGEFPYGANFAVRHDVLKMMGGFRTKYGRKLENFAGGEETVVCFLTQTMKFKVGLNPRSVVIHNVDPNRFTKEHVVNTVRSGIMTAYQLRKDLYAPYDWNKQSILKKINNLNCRIKNVKPNSFLSIKLEAEKECYNEILAKFCSNSQME